MTSPTEDTLISQAADGDPDAFSTLYERYVKRIYNYIYYRTGNTNDAEDLTARVFYRAMSHVGHYQNRGVPFSAWLYRIAHNLVANWHRDNSRRREVALDDQIHLPLRSDLPEVALLRNQDFERLLQAIRMLPGDRQHLLVLKFVEHLSNAEIAVIMGRSEGAIKSLYHRTLLSLRSELEKLGISGEEA